MHTEQGRDQNWIKGISFFFFFWGNLHHKEKTLTLFYWKIRKIKDHSIYYLSDLIKKVIPVPWDEKSPEKSGLRTCFFSPKLKWIFFFSLCSPTAVCPKNHYTICSALPWDVSVCPVELSRCYLARGGNCILLRNVQKRWRHCFFRKKKIILERDGRKLRKRPPQSIKTAC